MVLSAVVQAAVCTWCMCLNVFYFGFYISCVGGQFSFIPSPNITILQSAVYQCTVDGVSDSDTISVHWIVNRT